MYSVYGLLNLGGDVNLRDNNYGFTALHFAILSNNIQVVQALLERNCNVNSASFTGMTPLHLACYYGNVNIIQLLLANGATKEVTDNTHGRYPIHYLALAGHADSLSLLLEDNPHLASCMDKNSETPMQIALRLGHKKFIQAFCQIAKTDLRNFPEISQPSLYGNSLPTYFPVCLQVM